MKRLTDTPPSKLAIGYSAIVNAATQVVGQMVTLSWDSKNTDSCTASGGEANDGWTGTLSLSGSMQITGSSGGSAAYSITCTGARPAATAQAIVNFTEAAGSGSTGTSKGGGGAMNALWLLLLSLPVAVRVHRRLGRKLPLRWSALLMRRRVKPLAQCA